MGKQHKILFIVPYALGKAPSQRFRVELYLPVLDAAGIQYRVVPFLSGKAQAILHQPGNMFKKGWAVLSGFVRRKWLVWFQSSGYNFVFIHREAAPLGPPVFEWILAKILRKKIIYDFDDAIWIPNTSQENKLAAVLKCFWKIKYICKWSYKVVGGNEFLCDYARQFNNNVIKIPTVVDLEKGHNKIKSSTGQFPVIGWTGSFSTLPFLNIVLPLLQQLQEEIDFAFVVIADRDPQLPLKNYQFIKWSAASEASDLLKMDIGIMPLTKDKWSEGKCGFKLIQYMALGIPAVASNIGVNSVIIENGVNGFICDTEEEWKLKLKELLQSASLRQAFGKLSHEKIKDEYSLQSQQQKFLGLFN